MGDIGESANKFEIDPEEVLLANWARDFRLPLLRYLQKRAPKSIDPEDLVQEVFVRLAKHANLASIERIEGYLFRTAASVLATQLRQDARSPKNMDAFDESNHGEEELSPESVLIGQRWLAGLIEKINALPDRTRHIFVLYHFEHMTQKDIAARFNMPISTVEKHMARANKNLMHPGGRRK